MRLREEKRRFGKYSQQRGASGSSEEGRGKRGVCKDRFEKRVFRIFSQCYSVTNGGTMV